MDINFLIETNKGLIYKISKFFYGIDQDDLYQAGVLGILKAYKNYRENATVKFSSYAYDYIYGEMYTLASNKAIKINKQMRKINKLVENAKDILFQKNGNEPSINDIALFLNVSPSLVEEALNIPKNISSLDEEESMYDYIKGPSDNLDEKILLNECIDSLSPEEKSIIYARYYEDLTQQEVARKLKMTQVKVSRYEKKSLNKMHDFITS